jgi:GTPase SAR1 family protein
MGEEGFHGKLRHPSTWLLAGPSNCGKTTFTMNLLRQAHELFEDPRCKQNIIFYYSIWQSGFDSFDRESIVRSWVGKMPTVEDFKERTLPYKDKGGSIVVLVSAF